MNQAVRHRGQENDCSLFSGNWLPALRVGWTVWLLGMWVSLPCLRLEAAIVFDPAQAREAARSNTITAVKEKAKIAARVGTTQVEMAQKEAFHQHSGIRRFSQHVEQFNAQLQEYTQQVRNLLTQGREMVTLNGSLRVILGQFDEGTRILEIKRNVAEILRTGREVWDIGQQGIDLFLDGYNLIGELRHGARGLNPVELVRAWESAALDNDAVHLYQSQGLIRVLRMYLPQMEWLAQKYAQHGAKLIELKKRLEMLEKEMERVRQRPVSQKKSPGDIQHAPVGDREAGIPDAAQLPETGPSSPLPREETAAGIDTLTRNYHRTRDLIAEVERSMLQIVDESQKTTAEASERFEAALRAQLEQDNVEAWAIFAWKGSEESAGILFRDLIGDGFEDTEKDGLDFDQDGQ